MKKLLDKLFPVGRSSLVLGVHQFIWHPLTVYLAWKKLYGQPSWKEFVCIIIHDWGYWFCRDMDGQDGQKHSELGHKIAYKLFGHEYAELCLYHSRHYAKDQDIEPSQLCYADKLSIVFEPWWFYLPRAWLTGELKHYRQMAAKEGFIPSSAPHREWFEWLKIELIKFGTEQKIDTQPAGWYIGKRIGSTN